jgi:spermidine/putrescine transport system ATP-binding protein
LNTQHFGGVGPNKRATALIFQNLALFPLVSAADNIAYGLRAVACCGIRTAYATLEDVVLSDEGGDKPTR